MNNYRSFLLTYLFENEKHVGAVRRQFVKGDVVGSGTSSTPVTSGNIGKEQQLLDYQTHQYRLFIPLV